MDIVERCKDYLSTGGLFNPELANHDAVRDLIIDCRDEVERLREVLRKIGDGNTCVSLMTHPAQCGRAYQARSALQQKDSE